MLLNLKRTRINMSKKIKVLPISDIHGQFGVFRYIANSGLEPDLITISGDLFRGYALEPQELVDEVETPQDR